MTDWFKQHYLCLVVLATFIGFAADPLYRHLFSILAVAGLYLIITRHRSIMQHPQIRHFTILFSCLWLPMCISLIDAEFLYRSLDTTLRFLGYLFAAIYIIFVAKQQSLNKLLFACYGFMLFLSFDGLLQWSTGSNLFGYPAFSDSRLVGMFSPDPYLGLFLAVFAPLFFESTRQLQQRYKFAWLGLIPFILVILLAASRSAWMLLAIASMCYAIYFLRIQEKINWRRFALQLSSVAITIAIVISQSSYMQTRIQTASHIFSGDYELANQASSLRLPMWQTAITMTKDNWINGVGPRAFSPSYDQYSDSDNVWYNKPTGQPHLYILEISAETGLIGVLGYMSLLALLLIRLWKLSKQGPHPAIAWGMCALIASFPLSAAMPLFGFFAAQLFWFPLIIFYALQTNNAQLTNAKS